MNIVEEIKLQTRKKGVTLSAIAKYMAKRTGRKYTLSSLSKKIRGGTIRFREMELVAAALGMNVYLYDKADVEEFEGIKVTDQELEFEPNENSVFIFAKPKRPRRKPAKRYRGGRSSMVEVF